MLENYWVERVPIERARACWLAPEIELYVDRLHVRGYADASIRQRVPVLCDFAELAEERAATDAVTAVEQIDGFVTSRLQGREAKGLTIGAAAACENAIRRPVSQMLRLASTGRVGTKRDAQPFPFQAVAPGFPEAQRHGGRNAGGLPQLPRRGRPALQPYSGSPQRPAGRTRDGVRHCARCQRDAGRRLRHRAASARGNQGPRAGRDARPCRVPARTRRRRRAAGGRLDPLPWKNEARNAMTTALLAVGFISAAMAIMAVGLLSKNRCLRGSCGGSEVLDAEGDSLRCGACPRRDGPDPEGGA